jgi:hypothetical protein
MITVKQLTNSFQGMWEQAFPLLTTSFIRVFNQGHKCRVTDSEMRPVLAVPIESLQNRPDLVSEIAFCAAGCLWSFNQFAEYLPLSLPMYLPCISDAASRIARLEKQDTVLVPSSEEISEADSLLRVYWSYFSVENLDLRFRQPIPGAGILSTSECDISDERSLYEVKTITRSVSMQSFKQVLVYCVLLIASGAAKLENGIILNPRLATYYFFNVREIVTYLSCREFADAIDHFLLLLNQRETMWDNPF